MEGRSLPASPKQRAARAFIAHHMPWLRLRRTGAGRPWLSDWQAGSLALGMAFDGLQCRLDREGEGANEDWHAWCRFRGVRPRGVHVQAYSAPS